MIRPPPRSTLFPYTALFRFIMIYWLRAALTSVVTLNVRAREGQAVIPLLRGRSPTRSVAPKPLRGLGRASLGLPWARGCRRNPARRKRGSLRSLTHRPSSRFVYVHSAAKA